MVNDDMDVYVLVRKLDKDSVPLMTLSVPIEKQPHGTVFSQVDNLDLYKHIGPSGRLRASKREVSQDPISSEEQRGRQLPTGVWHTFDKKARSPLGQSWTFNIPIWPTGLAFEAAESMRIEVKRHNHHLHEWEDLGRIKQNLNRGTRTVLTGPDEALQVW